MSTKLSQLIAKDVNCITRAPALLSSVAGLSLLFVVLAGLAYQHPLFDSVETSLLIVGSSWLVFLFSSIIVLNHSFVAEQESGALLGIIMTGVDPMLIFLSKTLVNYVVVALVALIVLFLHAVFFDYAIAVSIPSLWLVFCIVALGFVSLGTILSAISSAFSEREIILPLVLFPICIPLCAGGVHVTRTVFLEGALNFSEFWFVFVCVFSLIALFVSAVLFEYVTRR